MSELYVYYKVADVAAALAVIAAWPALPVLRRSDETAGPPTWMEIHRGPDADRTERLLAAALKPYLAGPRHIERFEPVRAS